MLKPSYTAQFKKDYKAAVKRGLDIQKLMTIITMLCYQQALPPANKDHKLKDSKDYKDMRECHIEPDWLLVYQIQEDELILKLVRTGSHSELFK